MCYHILGVKLSLGLKISESTTSETNLTRLCKGTRSRKEKKTGRKRPRPNDIDVQDEVGSVVDKTNDERKSKQMKKSEFSNEGTELI